MFEHVMLSSLIINHGKIKLCIIVNRNMVEGEEEEVTAEVEAEVGATVVEVVVVHHHHEEGDLLKSRKKFLKDLMINLHRVKPLNYMTRMYLPKNHQIHGQILGCSYHKSTLHKRMVKLL